MYRGFWYAQALDLDSDLAPALQESIQADVCIVGGGFLGLWSAIRLKQAHPEKSIVIVERDRCGAGASGRNGGIATNWWAKYLSVMSICGAAEARRICEAAESAIDEIGSFCQEHGIDAQYRKDGWLWTATNQRQMNSWRVLTESLGHHGVNPFQDLDRQTIQGRVGSPLVLGGIYDPNAATVQPAMLARGLRRVALKLGVKIYEKTPLTELERGPNPVVHTQHGRVKADRVVLAMNAWGARFPELRRMIAVMSSDMVATAPVKAKLDAIGFSGGECMTDSRTVLNYWRNTPDGRVVFGKPLGQFGFAGRIGDLYEKPSPAADKVTAELRRLYPQLSSVPIVSSWTGPIDRAMKGLPNFGFLDHHRNVSYGIGFSGNGVATTVFASRIIKSLVENADDEWANCGLVNQSMKMLPPEPFRFFGAHMVRDALVRKESLEDHDKDAGFLTRRLVAMAPAGYVPAAKK